MKKFFAPREVARILGIPEARIRRWARLGLVPCQERPREKAWLPFKGLVALRTIKALRDQGVSLRQIKTCVDSLKRWRPDLTEPLAEVRFSAERRQLVMGRGRRRFTPEGQLHLDFGGEKAPHSPGLSFSSPGELLHQALGCEQVGATQEAREKYAALLALSREEPDALINIANTLYRCGFPEGATAHYLKALELDPAHPVAHYNLANLLEERADLPGAIGHYRQALDENPEFAEACFNLARVLEKAGDAGEARRYWHLYLDLEPEGEWAQFLKQRLNDDK